MLTTLTWKGELDANDKVLVLRFGSAADAGCLQLDDTVSFFTLSISDGFIAIHYIQLN